MDPSSFNVWKFIDNFAHYLFLGLSSFYIKNHGVDDKWIDNTYIP